MQPKDPNDTTGIVIDNGSYTIVAGFSGDDCPKTAFRTMVGRHIAHHKGLYVGDDAKDKESYLNINYPINRGIITDWDAMEEVGSDLIPK